MLTKTEIWKKFQKKPERYWKVSLFENEGFERRICKTCNKGFWSLEERENCPEHDFYGFIGNPVTKVRWDYFKAWKKFEQFFVKRGHTLIKRYPVVSRWHPTLYFTIASIQNFIRIDAGILNFEYPANPLIVPQVCLRFNDIPNVGVTGKHLTCFIMGGQHAFNDESNKGYWKDECLELDFEFFTKVMGVPKEKIIYVEDIWSMPDFSALGPTIEAHLLGLEIVNHVFMEFSVKNSGLKELPIKVIDTGWGFDRIPWFTQGAPTIYDVAFKNVIEKLKEKLQIEYDKEFFEKYARYTSQLNVEEVADIKLARIWIANKLGVSLEELKKKVEVLEALYAICDHARTLVFAIADGALPSNVGGGYNLRVILRRALGFIQKFDWPLRLDEVVLLHIKYLKKLFPELEESTEEIRKIIEIEEERYLRMKERVQKIVQKIVESKKELEEKDLIKLYESEGVSPEQLIKAGLKIKIPQTFYQKITQLHATQKIKKEKLPFDVSDLPATKILFYKPIFSFKAKVLKVFDNWVVLNQTAFYPTSGGQLHDVGKINGAKVLDVIKVGNVILHKVSEKLKEGEIVKCRVDKKRRMILTLHHDAVHIVNAVARKVLGAHVNQYGAEKDVDKARIDITHYANLSEEEIEKIEKIANEIVRKGLPIIKKEMKRSEAEQKYGFRIYQGGYIPSQKIRIIEIPKVDVEACSGTHSNKTSDVRIIKIIKSKRIADGLVRIELVAGKIAENYLKEKAKILEKVARKLGVREEKVPKKVREIFERWKKLRKELKKRKLKNC